LPSYEYDQLAEEFELIHTLLAMREKSGLSQAELAQRMGTNKSSICRLEKGNTDPSLSTLKKYAKACGFQITMDFHPA
jgi:transcriptional regulator with XRE-family HTH domain